MQHKHVIIGELYVKTIYCGKKSVLSLAFKYNKSIHQSKLSFIESVKLIQYSIYSLGRKQYWEMSTQNIINEQYEESLCGEPSGKLADNRTPEPNTDGACYRRAYWKAVYLRLVH